jgi:hypothetical protein
MQVVRLPEAEHRKLVDALRAELAARHEQHRART